MELPVWAQILITVVQGVIGVVTKGAPPVEAEKALHDAHAADMEKLHACLKILQG